MQTRRIQLVPQALSPVDKTINLAQLRAVISDIERIVPQAERETVRVHVKLDSATWDKPLTQEDILRERIDGYEAVMAQLRDLMHASGTLVPDAAERLQALLVHASTLGGGGVKEIV